MGAQHPCLGKKAGETVKIDFKKFKFFLTLSYMDKITLCLGLVFKPHFYKIFFLID